MGTPSKIVAWVVLATVLLAAPAAGLARTSAAPPARPAPFDPYILTVIEAEGQADFYVVLKVQADLRAVEVTATRQEKGRVVVGALTEVAAKTQQPLLSSLAAQKAAFQPYWIRNMVRVRGDKALLYRLAARSDVAEIVYEHPPLPEPTLPSPAGPAAVTWNVARVNADDVWALGITGAGAVIGNLDTGVQWDHPALVNAYRPQIPGTASRHDYNWWDGPAGSAVPLDYESHGTHTTGILAGDDGAGNQIGVAPGARWIACAGLGPHATPTDCFQFFLAPTRLDGSQPRPDLAPHVINNSWTSATDYQAIIQTLHAAGIFLTKSAGNSGPGCGTISNPGQWPEVTAAGAFGQGDFIASFSSRGPVVLGHDTLVKPDLAAPGVGVRSSVPGGAYAFLSGTSMAAPHVAGAVALLISARPELAGKVDVLQRILERTAEPKASDQCPPHTGVPNNVWGWGILDVYAAVQMAQSIGLGGIAGHVTDGSTEAPVPGAALTFQSVAEGWQFGGRSGAAGDYARFLPAAVYTVTAEHYGYLPARVTGVAVSDGISTTLDLPLTTAPLWTVSGHVTEEGTGLPLAASLVFEETPVTATTDPAAGSYSTQVAQGTWWMQAASPGHARASRQVPVDSDRTEDWSLAPIHNYYASVAGQCGSTQFRWLDAGGGTQYRLADDSVVSVWLPDGRPFVFYGQSYDSLYVGSNGLVLFGAWDNGWSGPLPDPKAPNNAIYAFSTDLDPQSGAQGAIYTDYVEARYFVIEWRAVQHYGGGSPETFEIVLDLDTGVIKVQYQTVSDPSDAVVGVENAGGTEATQYAYGDPARIYSGAAVEFHPAFGTPPAPTGEGRITGAVRDARTGAGIPGAQVTAVTWSTGEVLTYTAGAGGEYASVVCAGSYTLTASAPGYRTGVPVPVAVVAGGVVQQDLDLVRILHIFLPQAWLYAPGASQPGP